MNDRIRRLAGRNTLACLHCNLRMYRRAGNVACAELFASAIELRYQLIAAGVVLIGELEGAQ